MSTKPDIFAQFQTAFSGAVADPPKAPFSGDQRARVLKLLVDSLQNGRQTEVIQVISRDPSIIQESITSPGEISSGSPLPIAILQAGMPAAFMLAVAHGFDINTPHPSHPEWSWPLHSAVTQQSISSTSLLLGLGANPNPFFREAPVSKGGHEQNSLLYIAVDKWAAGFEKDGSVEKTASNASLPGVIHFLLDAGAKISPSDDSKYLHTLILRGDWQSQAYRTAATKLIVRLQKAGLDINSVPNSALQNPLAYAIGRSNGHAAETLVLLGAEVGVFGDYDIVGRLLKNNLEEFIPRIQAHLMNRTIKESSAMATSSAGIVASSQPDIEGKPRSQTTLAPASNRRRVNAGI